MCFLNIKEGGKTDFRNIRNGSSVKWPVVLLHLTTVKVKTKYLIIVVACIYLEMYLPVLLPYLMCIFPISVPFKHANS